eukprot:6183589-Pleurochrysis_carterae.AAC.1
MYMLEQSQTCLALALSMQISYGQLIVKSLRLSAFSSHGPCVPTNEGETHWSTLRTQNYSVLNRCKLSIIRAGFADGRRSTQSRTVAIGSVFSTRLRHTTSVIAKRPLTVDLWQPRVWRHDFRANPLVADIDVFAFDTVVIALYASVL